jgi:hypothetical protein
LSAPGSHVGFRSCYCLANRCTLLRIDDFFALEIVCFVLVCCEEEALWEVRRQNKGVSVVDANRFLVRWIAGLRGKGFERGGPSTQTDYRISAGAFVLETNSVLSPEKANEHSSKLQAIFIPF